MPPPPSYVDDPIPDFFDDDQQQQQQQHQIGLTPAPAGDDVDPIWEGWKKPVKKEKSKKKKKGAAARYFVTPEPEPEVAATPEVVLEPEPGLEPHVVPGWDKTGREDLPVDDPAPFHPPLPAPLSILDDDDDHPQWFRSTGRRREPSAEEEQKGVALPDMHFSESPALDFGTRETLLETAEPRTMAITPALSQVKRSPRLAHAKPASVYPSPPTRYAKMNTPVQQPLDNNLPRYGDPSGRVHRTESFGAHTASRARFIDPPPPHMPQPHFFGLPELLDLGQKKPLKEGKPAGSDGYCCVFDTFCDSGDLASSTKAKDALLVGSEGGIDVYRVLPNKLEVVGHLEGLRGSVIGAKILPQHSVEDPLQSERPMIALVIHGPASERQPRASVNEEGIDDPSDVLRQFDTSVEIYSLRTHSHIATLYRSNAVMVKPTATHYPAAWPEPVDQLQIGAKGKFVVVASGKSGEIFVFSAATTTVHSEPQFRCIGKLWTTLQIPPDVTKPSGSKDGPHTAENASSRSTIPLMSLSDRWLALVWPTASLHNSILGSPLLPEQNPTPVGVGSHVSPPPPLVTCDVAGVDEEGAIGRLTRQAAQGIVKYSQKGIEMGWQGWKELTNPTPPSTQHARNSSENEQFPPTKAPPDDARRTLREPALVSIVDLDALLEAENLKLKASPPPLATFALTEGCNFLSFSHSGLRLLTVNRSGEASSVWDLTRSCHGSLQRETYSEAETQGPSVKQILRIPRSSNSVAIDAAWSRDDDCLALLTMHGTVHLHEIPNHPPSPRRQRRSTLTAAATDKALPTVSLSSGISPPSSNGLFGTIKSSWQQVSTGVTTIRSQTAATALGLPTSFAGFKEATANASHAGGRLVAKGISQGYTAAKGGASDYWHSEDNKIRHRTLQESSAPGCLRWTYRQNSSLLAITCGGNVRLYPVIRTTRRKGEELVTGLKHEKGVKIFALQSIRTRNDAAGQVQAEDCATQGPHGFWTLRTLGADDASNPTQAISPSPAAVGCPPVLQNDVETNPPYCPFHVDPRVNIYAFDDDSPFYLHGHGFDVDDPRSRRSHPWLFGAPLPPATKISIHDDDEGDGIPSGGRGFLDSDDELANQVESRLTIRSAVGSESGTGAGDMEAGGSGGRLGSGERTATAPIGGEEEIHVHSRRVGARGKRREDFGGDGDDDEFVDEDAFGAVEDF